MTSETPVALVLPQTPLAQAVLALTLQVESPAIANHSIRSFVFARLFADHIQAASDADYDPDLLFAATVLHDIGLSEAGNGHRRFEVDGADKAAEFLTEQGLGAAAVDSVWEAIALHTTQHIADRRGTLSMLTTNGISLDFGKDTEFISDELGAAIHAQYPRHSMATSVVDVIVEQATARPDKAPPFSPAFSLMLERRAGQRTMLEHAADLGRWGN
ncbi:HD domain-containing protein [Nocardia colli]|uniref:HD domain-containing protein n=1 Tax=Nocardia colli TaxID=2545717 RepID=A0A5N0EH13_9NOCA|nr:HD domain-containing protein [Nocardia colli]KAA8888120.1 HD domain-containing protein [Nocardia colli]